MRARQRPARLLACAALALSFGCDRAGSRRPNVLVVTLDTFRADVMPGFGGDAERLPNFAAWMAEGTRYTRAYATAPLTVPSHNSLFTGLVPSRHGVRTQIPRRRAGEKAAGPSYHLLEAAKRAGFARGGFVATKLLSAAYSPLPTAFDHFDAPTSLERPGRQVLGAATKWLASIAEDRPVLVWLHFYEAHYPYAPLAPVPWQRCPLPMRERARQTLQQESRYFDASRHGEPSWPDCLGELYRGEVATLDALVPRMRGLLAARGPFVWLVVADHGECLGEEGVLAQHVGTLLECAVAIPMALGGVGLPKGAVDARLVSMVDVAPTLAGALGLEVPKLDGVDLRAGDLAADRVASFESPGMSGEHDSSPAFGAWVGDEKFTTALPHGTDRVWRRAASGFEEVSAMSERTRAVREELGRDPPPEGTARLQDGPETEALRSLGYVR